MQQSELVSALGWIFEHSPWVAEQIYQFRPFEDGLALHQAMCRTVQSATPEAQLALIRAHPDLGSRAKMADASVGEQKGAGLDQLSAGEFEQLQQFNRAYVQKFGFPFIFAVKGKNKHDIFASMQDRLANAPQVEFDQALEQIYKIAGFRLADTVEDNQP